MTNVEKIRNQKGKSGFPFTLIPHRTCCMNNETRHLTTRLKSIKFCRRGGLPLCPIRMLFCVIVSFFSFELYFVSHLLTNTFRFHSLVTLMATCHLIRSNHQNYNSHRMSWNMPFCNIASSPWPFHRREFKEHLVPISRISTTPGIRTEQRNKKESRMDMWVLVARGVDSRCCYTYTLFFSFFFLTL